MPPSPLIKTLSTPLFTPRFFNIDYFFNQPIVFWHWITAQNPSNLIYFISYTLTLFGITITIYCTVRIFEMYYEEQNHLKHAIHEYQQRLAEKDSGKNMRWEHVLDLVSSVNETDWRLSIIEADSILEGLLESKGIPGAGIGERLKNISPGDLKNIQAAWDAHLVRNKIAHEGSEFKVSQYDANKTVRLYEAVFRELGFI